MCKLTLFWTPKLWEFLENAAIYTDDEKAVQRLILKGYKNKEIARELHISVSTVSRRIHSLRQKYDYLQAQHPELPKRKK